MSNRPNGIIARMKYLCKLVCCFFDIHDWDYYGEDAECTFCSALLDYKTGKIRKDNVAIYYKMYRRGKKGAC